MKTYRLRVATVEAEEWQPGAVIPGVETIETLVKFNVQGTHCYFVYADERPRFWMGVETRPGIVPEAGLAELMKSWLQVTRQGVVYHREMLPFHFWDFKLGSIRPVDPVTDKQLYGDYAAYHEWPAGKVIARVSADGYVANVYPGDWVVRQPGGALSRMTAEVFDRTYKRVPTVAELEGR